MALILAVGRLSLVFSFFKQIAVAFAHDSQLTTNDAFLMPENFTLIF